MNREIARRVCFGLSIAGYIVAFCMTGTVMWGVGMFIGILFFVLMMLC
jgi:hypothetical protein